MTEPSQYFKGRTVQEQMNEIIGYVDVRAEEVAAAKADDVLEPAEQAKDDAIAAKEGAEDARDATLAALPQIQQDITDLKAEDVALSGRLDNVELRITTAEGNIVTIQGRVTALETADGQNVKLTGEHAIGNYAVLLTGNQTKTGILYFKNSPTIQAPSHAGLSILNQNIESWDTTPPDVTERQRVFQISDKSNTQYMFRLNVDITNTGSVRLNYERRQIVNGVNTYDSGYLL